MDEKKSGFTQPVLTGDVQVFSSEPLASQEMIPDSNVQFIVGADGHRYAITKPKWNWKGFLIGFSIPTAFVFISIMGMYWADGVSRDHWDQDPRQSVKSDELSLINGSDTRYEGLLDNDVPSKGVVVSCSVFFFVEEYGVMKSYSCEKVGRDYVWPSDFDIVNYTGEEMDVKEIVGGYDSENRTFWLDDGDDKKNLGIEISWVPDADEYSEWLEDIPGDSMFPFLCCLSPILGILGAIVAFATGRKDMGIGFLVAIVAWPFVVAGAAIGLDGIWSL